MQWKALSSMPNSLKSSISLAAIASPEWTPSNSRQAMNKSHGDLNYLEKLKTYSHWLTALLLGVHKMGCDPYEAVDVELLWPDVCRNIYSARCPQIISDFRPQNFRHLGDLRGDFFVTWQIILKERNSIGKTLISIEAPEGLCSWPTAWHSCLWQSSLADRNLR